MKSDDELQQLAESMAELDRDDPADRKQYFELIKDLTRDDCFRLASIHRRRAEKMLRGPR